MPAVSWLIALCIAAPTKVTAKGKARADDAHEAEAKPRKGKERKEKQPRAIEIEFPDDIDLPFARTTPNKPVPLKARWAEGKDGPELAVWVNFGTVTGWHREPGGVFAGAWQPPDPAHPGELQVVVSTVVAGRVVHSAQTTDVSAEIELPGKSEPDAEVEILLDGDSFGPVRAAHDGRFSLLVKVPPNTQSATVKSRDRIGNVFKKTVNLFVPVVSRLALVCPIQRVQAGGPPVTVSAANAKEAAGHVAPLVFKPPEKLERSQETLTLTSAKLGSASCLLAVDAHAPEKALVFWEPPFIVSDGEDKTVLGVRVTDRFGNPSRDAQVLAKEEGSAAIPLSWSEENKRFEASVSSRRGAEERKLDVEVRAVAASCKTSMIGDGGPPGEKDYRGIPCALPSAPSFIQRAVLQQIPDRGVRLSAMREGETIVVRVSPAKEATAEKVQAADQNGKMGRMTLRKDGALIVPLAGLQGDVLVTHLESGTSVLVKRGGQK